MMLTAYSEFMIEVLIILGVTAGVMGLIIIIAVALVSLWNAYNESKRNPFD